MFFFKESSRDIWLLLLVVLMSLAANLPEGMAAAYSIEKNYLIMALIAVIVVAILRYLRFALVLTIFILVVGANLPTELARSFNIHPAIMLYTLIVIVVIAAANRFLRVVPQQPAKANLSNSANGARALMKAISNGNVANVKRLIQSGVNVNVTTISGKTPLMLAAFKGYGDIVQLLIDAGADRHAADREGNTALKIAERQGFTRTKALLLTHGELTGHTRPSRHPAPKPVHVGR